MSIPLILFFTSLLSIIVMIMRKLPVIPEQNLTDEKFALEIPYLQELKEKTAKNIRKHGYNTLVTTLRWYVRLVNFFKSKYEVIQAKIKLRRDRGNINGEKKETSKFLRVIGEYKQKVREIKHRISKEESL